MFDATQISNKKDLHERDIFLETIENIALCHISKNICDMFVFYQRHLIIIVIKIPIIKYSFFIVFNSLIFVRY